MDTDLSTQTGNKNTCTQLPNLHPSVIKTHMHKDSTDLICRIFTDQCTHSKKNGVLDQLSNGAKLEVMLGVQFLEVSRCTPSVLKTCVSTGSMQSDEDTDGGASRCGGPVLSIMMLSGKSSTT